MPDAVRFDGGALTFQADRAEHALDRGTARGLHLGLEHLLGVSNQRVPIEYGDLERSGVVSMSEDGDVGAVSYNTEYAVRQHEELDWVHDAGRQAKFLESAATDEAETVADIIAAELRGEL